MTDAVAVTLITSITSIIMGLINRRATKNNAKDIHKKLDTMSRQQTAEMQAVSTAEGDRVVELPVQPEAQ